MEPLDLTGLVELSDTGEPVFLTDLSHLVQLEDFGDVGDEEKGGGDFVGPAFESAEDSSVRAHTGTTVVLPCRVKDGAHFGMVSGAI